MAARMSRDLTDAETFLPIELLQGQQNLWDTSCKTYHDRQKRTESLIYILQTLGVPELSGKFWIGVAMWLAHWQWVTLNVNAIDSVEKKSFCDWLCFTENSAAIRWSQHVRWGTFTWKGIPYSRVVGARFSPIFFKGGGGGGGLIWVLYIIVFIMSLKGNFLYNQQSVHLLWLCGKLVSYTWYRWNQSHEEEGRGGGGMKFVNKLTCQYEYLLHYFLLILPSGFCSVDFFKDSSIQNHLC